MCIFSDEHVTYVVPRGGGLERRLLFVVRASQLLRLRDLALELPPQVLVLRCQGPQLTLQIAFFARQLPRAGRHGF